MTNTALSRETPNSVAPPPLTTMTLTIALGRCVEQFETIVLLCQRCETTIDNVVVERLLASACDLARTTVAAVAAIAKLARIPVAHACIAATSVPVESSSADALQDQVAPLRRLEQTVDLILLDTRALRNTVDQWSLRAPEAITPAFAAATVRHFGLRAASLKSLVDALVAGWPEKSNGLDLVTAAASPTLLASSLAAAKTAAALSALDGTAPGLPGLADRLDGALCRLASLAMEPRLGCARPPANGTNPVFDPISTARTLQ